MQANRITASRRAPWRIALDALSRAWGSAARERREHAAPADAPPAHAAEDIDALAAALATTDVTQATPVSPAPEAMLGAVDFLAQLDDALRFQHVSDASIEFIGYHRDYLSMLTLHDLVASEEADELHALVARARASGRLESAVLTVVKSLTYPICVELRLISTAARGTPGFALAAFDVSHWREREAELNHQLHHDPLTGLENLTALKTAIGAAQAEAELTRTYAGLVLLGIDDYQRINRALGYDAGDELLRETARRIQHTASHGERVARVAGDEFAVLLPPGTSPELAEALGRRLLTAIAQPYRHRGQHTHLSASVGVALYPDQTGKNARSNVQTSLLRMADHALAQAKEAGGNALVFHTVDDNPADAERLKLEADLYEAVRNGEFSLYFQPITKILTGAVVGVEALMRWNHPVHGLVPPSTFIPLAESIGLINYLGNWVLKAACMQIVQWDAIGIRLDYVSVNVSPQQFRDKRFTAAVQEALALTGIDARRLVFEITESLLMHDPEEATGLLEALTAVGIRFAVDDFGTGYSSLAYLQRFPLSKLKIDRSFVENIVTSRNNRAIVGAVVGLAQSLGLELVAEGVETEAQRDLLAGLGCDHIQGWLISHALPSDELARSFQSNTLVLYEA
ncbi:EAL domain-containing protein [Caballeronia sp. LZ035]|uniref:putative bifunctional diguanylate cyclase/phosphodiesterase n=1 Tax=Caballeronia sp. LZ035 TaxID=3038568 RepID=UPI002866888D|nr:EAL domain-containing protein [Caballeronia sp. LZ035]MDR5757552.1 EAL domain-containing protein [Caballeronia sp. LZ035]